jgi:hypothetical protein
MVISASVSMENDSHRRARRPFKVDAGSVVGVPPPTNIDLNGTSTQSWAASCASRRSASTYGDFNASNPS